MYGLIRVFASCYTCTLFLTSTVSYSQIAVYDGYATQRLPLQSTYHVPDNTPNPSPVKPQTYAASTHSTPTRNNGTGIFRSASDTLAEVYGSSTPSPARSGRLHQTYSPSPSPCKKRSYTELDLDGDTEDEDDEPVDQDEDGDDAIMIILDKSDDNSAIESSTDISEKAKRPIKPLKKLTFGRSYSANDAESMPADVGKGKNQLAMDETWFSQPF